MAETQTVSPKALKVESVENVQCLIGHLVVGSDVAKAAIVGRALLEDSRVIGPEIFGRQNTARSGAGALDRHRDRPFIEAALAVGSDAPERARQIDAVQPVVGIGR